MSTQDRQNRLRQMYNAKVPSPRRFDNIHADKRGFIIGCGASIKDIAAKGFDFKKLENEITYGVNNAYKLLIPTYLVFGDAYFWKHFETEVKKLPCYKIVPNNIIKGNVPDNTIIQVRRDSKPSVPVPSSMDGPISFLNNSGVAALRFAYIMGCNPIYLVGIDLGGEPDNTHFHDIYKEKKLRTTPPNRYAQFCAEFERTIAGMRNRKIISCSEISPLNTTIPYVPLASLEF